MTTGLVDYVTLNGSNFPKSATRKELESLGARHIKTDRFVVEGTERDIEYMVLENENMVIWKRYDGGSNYTLHLFAPSVVKFP
ncbi:MAG: hypothetical protein AABX91_01020 [Nanoarchaeota archaeon]